MLFRTAWLCTGLLMAVRVSASCVSGPVVITTSPAPGPGGTYQCGQTVTFCMTVPAYTQNNSNWLHGVTATFGPGWDLSTLTPGPPPATMGTGGGTWGWYNSVTGTSTAGANAGTVGPGFFFDLDNDGNPGNNFGDNALTGPWTFCWTISVLNAPACVGGANLSVVFRAYADSQTGSWGTGGCGNATVNTTPLTVASCNLNPGTNGTLSICSNAAAASLFAQLGGGPQTGGTWTGPGGAAHGANYNPAADGPGGYTYTVTGTAPCTSASATVTVTETPAANAGLDATLAICGSTPAAALLPLLTGAQAGGTWTGPGGAAHGPNYDPAVDGPGVYTYTVVGTPPCVNDQATVTVTETAPPTAGADGALSICTSTPPTAMFPLLAGAQAGGSWTGPGGAAHGATYDPAVDAPGVYTYTVVGNAPCSNDQAIVTVTQNPAPNAGTDGTLTICGNSAPASLFAQLGGAQTGGSWTGPGGAVHGPTYDPAVDGPGVYTYTVGGTPPCTSDQATVTVTESAPPNAGTDGNLSICGSSPAAGLFALLGGAQNGGSWTDPGGAAHGANYDPAVDGPGIYTYTILGVAPCVNDQASITVTESAPVNAGTDGNLAICSGSAPAGLFALLGGAQAGGSWTAPGGAAHTGTYDPDTDGPGVYTYTLLGTPPCPNDQATVTVAENTPPNAGADGNLTLCSSSPAANLFASLTGADAGGTWTAPSGAAHSATYNPGTDVTGIYTYTVAGVAPCPNDQATVTVTEETLPNAGNDGNLSTCGNSAATDLFTLLAGAQVGGTWTAPGGAAHGTNYDPATDGPGVYTYTILGAAPCPNDQATVTVTENTPPDAGSDGTLTVCSSSASTGLFSALTGAQAGGTWTAPGGAVHGANYDPASDGPGVYTYTVAGIAPCVNDQATVTVTENPAPDAGTDGTLAVCSDGAPVSLFAQLGGGQAGGTWTAPGGAAHGANYDPATDGPGVYTYTVAGAAPCPNDQATVTVTENAPPNAGADAPLTVCSSSAAADMFPLLVGAQPGGTWTDAGGSAHSNTYDPATDNAGAFTYTVAGVVPCANDQATVTVTENLAPDAGTDGTLTICGDGAPISLFAQLGGAQAGGTWTDAGGAAHNGTYDPAANAPGIYTYTVAGAAPCPNDQATVTVTENAPPNAGTDAPLTVCSSSAAADMFPLLVGAQPGGSWTDAGGSAHSNTYDPATDNTGAFTYTVAGVAPCANDQATITVTENLAPDAGTDGTVTICGDGAPASLFAQLGGAQPGGTWTDAGGAAHSGTYDPAANAPGVYTYTVAGAAPCPNDQATVTVTENAPPNAGADAPLTVCSSSAAADMFPLLVGAQPGGSWTTAGGAAHSNTYDPATDNTGVFAYTVAGVVPCANDQATITVTENLAPDAGTDGTLTICGDGAPISLFAQLGGAQAGGTWTDAGGVAHNGTYDPAANGPGVFTYTVTGVAPCPNDQATVTVTENAPPNAGADAPLIICSSSAAADMFALLIGAQAGGSWTDVGGSAHSNTYDPATDNAGGFTYTVAGVAPCANDQATVTVTENVAPDAGTDGTLTICGDAAPASLFAQLGGAQAGGTWTDAGGVAHNGTYDPAANAPGVFTYTVAGVAPCPNDQATVTVTENVPPNAGADAPLTVCSSSAAADMFALLIGAQAGGSWTDVGGSAHSNTYDPATDNAGGFTYTVAGVAPCANDQATVTVTENVAPDAGTDGTLTICGDGTPASLFAQLGGAQAGGTWTAPGGTAHGANYDPATDGPGVFTYTVAGVAPCPNDQATVTVTENVPPNAGADAPLTVCSSSAAADMFALLVGAQPGGSWTDAGGSVHSNIYDPATDNAGVFTYTIAGIAPCANDQATITVTESPAPDAGTDGTLTVCDQAGGASLFAQLVNADAGGTWTDASGAAHSPTYDPAIDAAGVFTYTVAGVAPCPADQSTVTVTEVTTPEAGTGPSITLCSTDASVDLATLLTGADPGGAWTAPGGAAHSSTVDPSVDAAGAYTYTLAALPPCTGDQAQVTVTIATPPNAGSDGSYAVCDQGAPISLFAQLTGASPGGTWTDPSATAHGTNYDPAVDGPGIYTYTVPGATPCPADQATVTITETSSPNAGTDGSITLCSSDASVDLSTLLTGTDGGGTWTAPGGAAHSATLDPAVDPAGVYTYTIAAVAPCTGDQAQVTVTIDTPPNAGGDGSLTVCDQGGPADMFAQLSGADLGGTWAAPGGAAHPASYNPASDAPGVFTYTVNGNGTCPADQANVTVTETSSPNAGTDGSITLCSSDASVDLSTLLTGEDGGGTWTAPGGAAHATTLDPAVDPAGVYTYTIAAVAPCTGDQAQVTVTIDTPPNAGGDGSLTVCDQGGAADMFAQLAAADLGGSWTDAGGAAHPASYNPASDVPGVFTYTVNGNGTCPADQANVTVTETSSPNAGTDGSITLCSSDASVDLSTLLTGEDGGGTWTAPGGAAHATTLDPAVDPAGVYTYTIAAVAPCTGDQAQVSVTIDTPPNAGGDGALTVCDQGGAADMFAQLADADLGGSWTAPGGATHASSYDPASDAPGVFTYTVNGNGTCPADQANVTVTETSSPNAGGDGSIALCASDASVDLSTLLTGEDGGGTWTAPGGTAHTATLDPAVDPAGVYTYTIAAVAPCTGDQAQVSVTIDTPPNAGGDGALTVCDQGGAADMFAQLAAADLGGTWTDAGGAAHPASYNPASDVPGVFTYTVNGNGTCPADQANVTVTETSSPNAGGDGSIALCASDASVDLSTLLTGEDGGGTWTAPGGAAHATTLDPAVDPAGVYTYTIAAVAPCTGDQATVTVTIDTPPNAGGDGSLTVCDQGGPADMFAQLAAADLGGSWTDAGGAAHPASYNPASDVPGVFTYTVNGNGTCPADQANVTVTETSSPNAGTDGFITLCSSDASVGLSTLLTGADGGGTWTAPGGAAHAATLDPAVDPAGVYTYTIAAVAPCTGDQAQVTVTIDTPPNAGGDGALTVCDQGGAADMFAQLAGADLGGSWTDAGGAAHPASYDPATDSPSVFTYTVNGNGTCPADQANVTVTETSSPNAGTDGSITLCSSEASVDLSTLLTGADGGGTWTAPDGAVHAATVDPSVDAVGVYTYTIAAVAPCTGDQATVTVTIDMRPNAGGDGALTVCDQGGAADMFAQLAGADLGGTWTDAGGAAHASSYDPATDSPSVFTYTVNGNGTCPADQANVTVTETSSPNAGTDGSITLCSSDASVDLFTLLTGADGGGTWTAPGGAAHAATLDPAVDPAGVYTYTIAAVAPCTGDQAQVSVTIDTPPNAGGDGALTVCDQGGAADMFAQLAGADLGGSWTDAGGAAHASSYDPATDSPSVFTYTVNGNGTCPADQANVTVTETSSPNAGTDGSITLCSSDASVDLFTLLNGADGSGTWTAPDGSAHAATLAPATDASGVYTYTIAAASPCVSAQAQVTVTIDTPPNAGGDGALTVCDQGGAADMFAQLAAADLGGSWTDAGGAAHASSYDPATDSPSVFTYTVNGSGTCPADQANVTVTETSSPNAGTDGSITLCSSDASVDLSTPLTGEDGGGTWTAPDGSAHAATLVPATDASGVYTYTIAAAPPCVSAQAQVTVTIDTPPNAGGDGALTVCDQGGAADMFAQLAGADLGGSWTNAGGAAHASSYDPATDSPSVFTYTVNGNGTCPADQANVTVTETSSPNAGTDGSITLCSSDASADLFTLLNGADGGGTWTAPDGSAHAATLAPATDASGVYTYTIAAAPPCVSAQAQVTVTIHTPPNAGTDGTLTVCDQGGVADMFAQLAGADPGGTWTDAVGNIHEAGYDPAIDVPGVFTYTVGGTAPCPADQATVTVSETSSPNAGSDGSITLCASDASIDLFTLLTGADAGGTWTAPDGSAHTETLAPTTDASGVYIYTINAAPPCASAQSQVTVTINTPPQAGADAVLTVCDQGGLADLFAQLIGADANGAWTDPSGSTHAATFNPATDVPGVYTYTANGTAPCTVDQSTVTVSVTSSPNAGTGGSVTLCSSGSTIDLFDQLTGADGGGTWTDPSGNAHGHLLAPATDASGIYVYSIAAAAPCVAAQAQVAVTIHPATDAGTSASITLCATAPAIDMLGVLSGFPQSGGTWTGPDGALEPGLFTPGTSAPGDHTYTVTGIAPCVSSSAIVHIDVVESPDPGEDGALALCANGATVDLFAALGGTPDTGGTWTTPNGTPVSATLDPTTAVNGAYAYTLLATAPCPNAIKHVLVTVSAPPVNGLSAEVRACDTFAPVDLLNAFSGAAGPGGAWTAPNGSATASPIDPGIAASGTYTYTIAGIAPCANGVNTVLVTIDRSPDAGADGALSLCASGTPQGLFGQLGGTPDANGSWTAPNGDPSTGTVAPATAASGNYTYVVPANGVCPAASAHVTVAIVQPPDAGAANSLQVCENDATVDLFGQLLGTPQSGGTWTDPAGAAFSGTLAPGGAPAGAYTYTVPGLPPCPAAHAIVTVGIDQLPSPGHDNVLALCPEASAQSLFDLIAPATAGGAWSGPSGALGSPLFDPATTGAGTYTYTVTGTGACADTQLSSMVDVTVHPSPSSLFVLDTARGCLPVTVDMHLLDGSIASALWTLGGGGTAYGAPDASYTFTTPGWHSIAVTVTDTNGCRSSHAMADAVYVQPLPSALFSADPDPTSVKHPDVTFTPLVPGYTAYEWSVDGRSSGTGAPWTHHFGDVLGATYLVCLSVTDSMGCQAQYCDPVLVQDGLSVYVPNAFTPDGDGRNDGFMPVIGGADPAEYGLYIFDRWGLLIFESHRLGEVWNGGMHNDGNPLVEDVYVWKVFVKERVSAERQELTGHVTLLK